MSVRRQSVGRAECSAARTPCEHQRDSRLARASEQTDRPRPARGNGRRRLRWSVRWACRASGATSRATTRAGPLLRERSRADRDDRCAGPARGQRARPQCDGDAVRRRAGAAAEPGDDRAWPAGRRSGRRGSRSCRHCAPRGYSHALPGGNPSSAQAATRGWLGRAGAIDRVARGSASGEQGRGPGGRSHTRVISWGFRAGGIRHAHRSACRARRAGRKHVCRRSRRACALAPGLSARADARRAEATAEMGAIPSSPGHGRRGDDRSVDRRGGGGEPWGR
jgi:hypothetical protein